MLEEKVTTDWFLQNMLCPVVWSFVRPWSSTLEGSYRSYYHGRAFFCCVYGRSYCNQPYRFVFTAKQ